MTIIIPQGFKYISNDKHSVGDARRAQTIQDKTTPETLGGNLEGVALPSEADAKTLMIQNARNYIQRGMNQEPSITVSDFILIAKVCKVSPNGMFFGCGVREELKL